MIVWILQIRESGGEDLVYLFTTKEKAELEAFRQLYDYAETYIEDVDDIPVDDLEELGELVEHNDWGYYNIYTAEIK